MLQRGDAILTDNPYFTGVKELDVTDEENIMCPKKNIIERKNAKQTADFTN